MESAEGMEIIASQSGDFSTEKSLEVMQNLLQAHPQIDAVFTQDDGMALGVLQAIKEAKRTDIQFVTGAGEGKAVFEDIKADGIIISYIPLFTNNGRGCCENCGGYRKRE